jgi:RNA polymerase sigma-70 factor, ECF subfamily
MDNESLALPELFKEYKNKVYRLALSISRNEKDAEDIMQNTFVKIEKYLAGFRHQSSVSTWIYRIAYNEALMLLRKRGSQFRISKAYEQTLKKIPSGLLVNWPQLPDAHLLREELKQHIDDAINEMPIKYRMPLVLHHMEELPLQEAAIVLGLKLNSLKTRLHRAYLMIKNEMREYAKDHEHKGKVHECKTCDKVISFMYDYALGNLSAQKKADFEKHIIDCSGCKLFLDEYLNAIRITGALQCSDLPRELHDKIASFIGIQP